MIDEVIPDIYNVLRLEEILNMIHLNYKKDEGMKVKKLLGYMLAASLAASMLLSTAAMASGNTDEIVNETQSMNSIEVEDISEASIDESDEEYEQRKQEYEYFEYSPDFLEESFLDDVIKEVNKFRTSDTWYYDKSNNKVKVKGLKALKKDEGLQEIAKQRLTEIIFRYYNNHLKPNGCQYNEIYWKMVVAGIYEDIYTSECMGAYDGSDKNNHASAKTLVDGWKEENNDYRHQGHRRAMLDEGLKYIGSAVAFYNGRMIKVITMSDQPTGREEASNSKKFIVEVNRGQYSTDPRDWEEGYTVIPSGAKAVEAPRDPYWDIPAGCKAVTENPDDPDNPDGNSETSLKVNYKAKTDISTLISGNGVKTKYKSSNKKIAKVNKKGIVTGGKQAGTATITKYVKETKKSAWTETGSVTITNYNPTLPKKETLTVGNTINLNEKLTGSDETPISWESSNPDAVTVSSNGLATAVGQGTAKISPVFSYAKCKSKIKINVPKN